MASEGVYTNYKKVFVSEIEKTGNSFRFYAHLAEKLPEVENVLRELNVGRDTWDIPSDIKEGDMVAARSSVGNYWYRSKVESVLMESEKVVKADVLHIDFGKRETISFSDMAVLPSSVSSLSPLAIEYSLAFVSVPSDEEYAKLAMSDFHRLLAFSSSVEVLTVDSVDGIEFAQVNIVWIDGKRVDVAEALIEKGVARAVKKDGETNETIQKMVSAYGVAEEKARKEGVNIWAFDGLIGPEKEKRKEDELTKANQIRMEEFKINMDSVLRPSNS